jgi:hypothetical protein
MTPEGEKELIALMKRIADHIAPEKDARPRHTAVLGTATYTREEREKKELREKLRGKSGIQGNQAGEENLHDPQG